MQRRVSWLFTAWSLSLSAPCSSLPCPHHYVSAKRQKHWAAGAPPAQVSKLKTGVRVAATLEINNVGTPGAAGIGNFPPGTRQLFLCTAEVTTRGNLLVTCFSSTTGRPVQVAACWFLLFLARPTMSVLSLEGQMTASLGPEASALRSRSCNEGCHHCLVEMGSIALSQALFRRHPLI